MSYNSFCVFNDLPFYLIKLKEKLKCDLFFIKYLGSFKVVLDGQWIKGRNGIDHFLTIYHSVESAQQRGVEEPRNAKSRSP